MIIWLTGVPGVGKKRLAEALKDLLQNGRRVQILADSEVKLWVHPSTHPPMEERVAAVAWIARLLTQNDIDVIVCCMAPDRQQRITLRHKFYEEGTLFHEVWVDSNKITEEHERAFKYEHPDPPDSRVIINAGEDIDTLAERVIFELDL